MRYSQSTELAIDGLLLLAVHQDERELNVESIARALSVSPSYMAKVLQQLVKAGLLLSHRGPHGGYHLARPPAGITLLDIACVFDGASPLYSCGALGKRCRLGPRCLVVRAFRRAETNMQQALRDVTLAKMMAKFTRQARQAEWLGPETDAPVRRRPRPVRGAAQRAEGTRKR